MSDEEKVKKAAVEGLSRASDEKPRKENTKKDKAPKKTVKQTKTKAPKNSKAPPKSALPEKGSAEAEIHRQAAMAADIRLSEPELPQKGGAEAAVHNMASKAATGGASQRDQGNGFGFLAVVLLVPLAVIAGLYAFTSSLPERPAPLAKPANTDAAPIAHKSAVKPLTKAVASKKSETAEKPPVTTAKAARESKPVNTPPKTVDAQADKANAKATKTGKASWNYKSTNWASLDPAFKTCGSGKSQSPINIIVNTPKTGPSFSYNYAPSSGKVSHNGHSIQVDLDKPKQGSANQLLVNGQAYDLLKFHFHTPGENAINGRQAPMEVHLVHKNAQGQLAIVAVMISEGGANQLIDQMPVPTKKGDYSRSGGPYINPALLLPKNRKAYTFSGSLTTPPCTQNVGWIVMQTPLKISSATLARFKKVMGKNNRPLQPTNDRAIYVSN